jgi:hypothetical protein
MIWLIGNPIHASAAPGMYKHLDMTDYTMLCVPCRYKHLDMTDYTFLPVEQELPFTPVVPGIVGQ